MFRKAAAYLLACYFLIGSTLFPLGDFSLMKDLPQMYRAYQKLAPKQEQDIVDFVGDYLLNGKALLGHNKHDAPESSQRSVQFQHAANFCSITALHVQLTQVIAIEQPVKHSQIDLPVNTSDFHPELFRPPLAV
ncbi:hypothetical protein ACFGVR_03450 [Mucilaginibacter sp. AW1-3]